MIVYFMSLTWIGGNMKAYLAALTAALILFAVGCTDNTFPFTEVTSGFTFTYNLQHEGVVDIFVLNCYMNNVRNILTGTTQAAGDHSASWDLNDEDGLRVPDGLYYIRIVLDDIVIDTGMYEVYQ